MTAAILAALVPFVTALAPVFAQWLSRRWAAQADPHNQFAEQKIENAEAVTSDDPAVINRLLDERINRLRAKKETGDAGSSR